MTTQLPRRPYGALLPPADGLSVVRHEARRRRRRRVFVVATGGGVAAAVAAAALSLGGGGVAVLKPVPPAVQPTPAASGPALLPAPAASRPVTPANRPPRSPATYPAPKRIDRGAVIAPYAPAQPAANSAGSHQQALRLQVFRSHLAANQAAICPGSQSAPGPPITSGVGWCLSVDARPVTNGVRLLVQVCHDATGSGALTYSSTREVDLAVRRNGHTVWDWARDHPGSPSSHTRAATADGCWNWQLVWPDITQSGGAAGHGAFTFLGTSTAREVAAHPTESVQFSY